MNITSRLGKKLPSHEQEKYSTESEANILLNKTLRQNTRYIINSKMHSYKSQHEMKIHYINECHVLNITCVQSKEINLFLFSKK